VIDNPRDGASAPSSRLPMVVIFFEGSKNDKNSN